MDCCHSDKDPCFPFHYIISLMNDMRRQTIRNLQYQVAMGDTLRLILNALIRKDEWIDSIPEIIEKMEYANSTLESPNVSRSIEIDFC